MLARVESINSRYKGHVDDVFWQLVIGGLAPTVRDAKDALTVAELVEAHLVLQRREEVEAAISDLARRK